MEEIKVLPIFEISGIWIRDFRKDFNFENEGADESTDEMVLIMLETWFDCFEKIIRKDSLVKLPEGVKLDVEFSI